MRECGSGPTSGGGGGVFGRGAGADGHGTASAKWNQHHQVENSNLNPMAKTPEPTTGHRDFKSQSVGNQLPVSRSRR